MGRSNAFPSRQMWNVIGRPLEAATIGGISPNERTGLPSIARMASSKRRPAASAGCPETTSPTRTRGCTPIEPTRSTVVASERTATSSSSLPRRTRIERAFSGRSRMW